MKRAVLNQSTKTYEFNHTNNQEKTESSKSYFVRIKHILVVLLAMPLFWQCDFGPSKSDLRSMNDSLLMASALKEIQLNQMLESMSSIESNLKTIKEKEQIISLKAESGDIRGTSADLINEDIQLIYDLMVQNKERIQQLEEQMKKAGVDNNNLRRIITGLNDQLREKSEEIARLNDLLHERNLQIEQLNYTVSGLANAVDSIKRVQDQTHGELQSTRDNLNTAYYAIGTKKELKAKKIIVREGFLFFGEDKVLTEQFEQKYFNIIDIREVESIPVYRPKAELLTPHPQGSFELVKGDENNLVLVILNSEKFWSISKYLVIQVS